MSSKLSRTKAVEAVSLSIVSEEAECPEGIRYYGMVIGHGESIEISVNGQTVGDLMGLAAALSRASQHILSIAHGQFDEEALNKKVERLLAGVGTDFE